MFYPNKVNYDLIVKTAVCLITLHWKPFIFLFLGWKRILIKMYSSNSSLTYLRDKKRSGIAWKYVFLASWLCQVIFFSKLFQYFIFQNLLKFPCLSERIHGFTLLLCYVLCAACLWALRLNACNIWMTAGLSGRNLWLWDRVSVENLCSTQTQSLHCEMGL